MGSQGSAPGFFGKLMSHADFVTRRMPPGFLTRWDGWLQEAVHAARRRMGDEWLAIYLHSPIWRFAQAAGVCDQHAWAGVLMPSVDSVGRQFPLTIVGRMPSGAGVLDCLLEGDSWYAALEGLALSSLDDGFTLEAFDAALLATPPKFAAPGQPEWSAPDGYHMTIPPLNQLGNSPAVIATLAGVALHGHSLWWTEGAQNIAPSLLACKGLPAPTAMAGMLDGGWERSGWRSCE